MTITVISPTLNESENVRRLVGELEKVLAGTDYEIIIVDDDSPDHTWKIAEDIARNNPRVRVVRRTHNRGLGWSVIDGFSAAKGDLIACIDADLQHDPVILPRMIDALKQGSDLVVGSRYVQGGGVGNWRLGRRLGSWLATKTAQWVIGIRICDPMSGYFLLRRSDFLNIRERLDGQGFKILLEIAANLPEASISEVPYRFRNRTAGSTKLSRTVILAYLAQLWRLSRSKERLPRSYSKAS